MAEGKAVILAELSLQTGRAEALGIIPSIRMLQMFRSPSLGVFRRAIVALLGVVQGQVWIPARSSDVEGHAQR